MLRLGEGARATHTYRILHEQFSALDLPTKNPYIYAADALWSFEQSPSQIAENV